METNILIGKYTLESLTSGMYLSPLDIYREYVQNSADSIDEAIDKKILDKQNAQINISINSVDKVIVISDNGTGISRDKVVGTLIDIGNSKKDYQKSRGFRGIGRLSGLGYCNKLEFITSALGEPQKTIISFDAQMLQKLLLPDEGKQESLSDVLEKVIRINEDKEIENKHYFIVKMTEVHDDDGLLDYERVSKYLKQNLPLPFSPDFIWGSMIEEKMKISGINLPEYNVFFNYNGRKEILYKPYKNAILSDRIRHVEDPIKDIKFKTFFVNNKLCSILWYVEDNYYGTILNPLIKGIRIRNGNILFGDQNSLRKCFKEERFNGWLCGEIHMVSSRIIPNARRDDFERNEVYLKLLDQIKQWAFETSKLIRSISHKRNLDVVSNKIINAADKGVKDSKISIHYDALETGEDQLLNLDDSHELAKSDLLNSLSILANINNTTKYKVLNLSKKLTQDQKHTYEEIFDLIYEKFNKRTANRIIQTIVDNLVY